MSISNKLNQIDDEQKSKAGLESVNNKREAVLKKIKSELIDLKHITERLKSPNISSVKIIALPQSAITPTTPAKLRNIILAIFLGVIIGGFVAISTALWKQK